MFKHKLGTLQADAWPVIAHDRTASLDQVIIESHHPAGSGRLHLTPEQALYVQSRLGIVATGYLHHGELEFSGVLQGDGPGPSEHELQESDARVWAIGHPGNGQPTSVEEVIVESRHPQGHGIVHLSAAQADYVASRLTHIAMEHLHDDQWGGEDARRQ